MEPLSFSFFGNVSIPRIAVDVSVVHEKALPLALDDALLSHPDCKTGNTTSFPNLCGTQKRNWKETDRFQCSAALGIATLVADGSEIES